MTLPPASANRSSILALTAGDAPQPQSSPKVMVPSATSEIRTPDLPKSLYRMRFPQFLDGQRPLNRRSLRFTRKAAEALTTIRTKTSAKGREVTRQLRCQIILTEHLCES